jgi:predicted ArsR family transcriptional regulator
VKEEQALRSSLPALSRQLLDLAKTRSEITVKEIEDTTGANRNTIKVHVKKLTEQHYLLQVATTPEAGETPKETSAP